MKKKKLLTSMLGLLVLAQGSVIASTLVYSLRIRRALSVRGLDEQRDVSKVSVFMVPIYSQANSKITDDEKNVTYCEYRKVAENIIDVTYTNYRHWWAQLTTGLGEEWVKTKGQLNRNAKKFGWDDFVWSAGYNMLGNQELQFAFYGIGGIPASWTPSPLEDQDTFVGTKLVSLGAGSELSYSFINTPNHSMIFIFQNRLIYAFTRPWYPILNRCEKWQPGTAIDLLFGFMYLHSNTVAEAGYNPTFYNNEAYIQSFAKTNFEPYVRHGIYVRGSHSFKDVLAKGSSLVLGAGVSVSVSQHNERLGAATWLTLGGIF